MNDEEANFEKLKGKLLDAVSARGCTAITAAGYRYICNSIFRDMKNTKALNYTKEGGNKYLNSYLEANGENQYYRNLRTVVSRLNDIVSDVWEERHHYKNDSFDISDYQRHLVEEYATACKLAGKADGTIRLKKYDTELFFSKLNESGCAVIEDISAEYISKACIKIKDHNIWAEIRIFLRYLSDNGILSHDYSPIVPHYQKPYVLPSTYTIEEIRLVENVIDQSNEIGKRDYAMIILASRLGMRSGDIVNLTIDQVDFKKDKIRLLQQKTKKPLELPLIPEAKNALENYLETRHNTDTRFIFLNACAPYHPVTTGVMRYAVRKYLLSAGVDIRSKKHGPHTLRASLASSMVNDKVPYEIVRRILGHSSSNAIKHYARIDIERLRKYSLKPPVASGNFLRYLSGKAVVY